MKVKSLSVFRTKLHMDDSGTTLVNIGDVIEGDEEHLRSLARNRLVELMEDGNDDTPPPSPPKTTPEPKAAQGKKGRK